MTRKTAFIIILNWNSAAETIALVEALKNQTYRPVRTIVVDNGSRDGSIKKLTPYYGSVTLVRNSRNLGYAGGNNVGIDYAIHGGADYIWILNPDIRPDPEALSMLVEAMEQDPSLAAVGPRICYRDHPDMIYSDGGLVFPEKGFLVQHMNHQKAIHEITEKGISLVDYVNGSAILLRVEALREVGMFREDFFLYYEETDWCFRAKSHGWIVAVNRDAIAQHQSSHKGPRYHYFMARNRILLAKVHRQYLIRSVALELSLLRKYTRRPFLTNLPRLGARIAGVVSGMLSTCGASHGGGSNAGENPG